MNHLHQRIALIAAITTASLITACAAPLAPREDLGSERTSRTARLTVEHGSAQPHASCPSDSVAAVADSGTTCPTGPKLIWW